MLAYSLFGELELSNSHLLLIMKGFLSMSLSMKWMIITKKARETVEVVQLLTRMQIIVLLAKNKCKLMILK